MQHVFVSYAHEDRELCQRVVGALEASGLPVWWDDHLKPASSWDRQLESKLQQASVVIVVWTALSVQRDFVRSEAYRGYDSGKLIQLRMEDCDLPIGLDRIQAQDLLEWTGDTSDSRWRKVLSWIADFRNQARTQDEVTNEAIDLNPQASVLASTRRTLSSITDFLTNADRPWPLRRHVENQRALLSRDADFLSSTAHDLAFVGDIGVGKSTAINFIYGLLTTAGKEGGAKRGALEHGSGRVTLCEIHIQRHDRLGVRVVPLDPQEAHQLIADFCHAKWQSHHGHPADRGGGITSEFEKALRNMIGLPKTRDTEKKLFDPLDGVIASIQSEDQLRDVVLARLQLETRTTTERFFHGPTASPEGMLWLKNTFREFNFGLAPGMPLPARIEVLIPDFAANDHSLDLSVIDTKGVDKITIRKDLDTRLHNGRTTTVLCSRFPDAPGTSVQLLLTHLHDTFGDGLSEGRVCLLVLPRGAEALETTDGTGDRVTSVADGYAFKRDQVITELRAAGHADLPVLFFDAVADSPVEATSFLLSNIMRQRSRAADRLQLLCADVEETIRHHQDAALRAALSEAARRLTAFLAANADLGESQRPPFSLLLSTIRSVAHPQTVWASTRRHGDYDGLNAIHLIGVGASQDAANRSDRWWHSFNAFLRSVATEDELVAAKRALQQVADRAEVLRREFLDAVRSASDDTFVGPLSDAELWQRCIGEYGSGNGYKQRVADHLEAWFRERLNLDRELQEKINAAWKATVIKPLAQIAEEGPSNWR